ncbi:MAG: hypothetical protein CMD15_00175 [Flavobacteriales bacterium]|nr:hypothetical protein [Flavobacteriales bacterium]|tara:strand:+ start:8284 stop:9003 length:720 start_codon:yes stop_codon:yes gene_type:complete
MKQSLIPLFLIFVFSSQAQINIDKLKNASKTAESIIKPIGLTDEEIISGLKEALVVGTRNSCIAASAVGGFNNNKSIRIPFPEEAERIKKTLIQIEMQSQVDEFEFVLNQAAEDASSYAKDVFVNAIMNMTIDEAVNILNGENNAASVYLKKETREVLYSNFKPVVIKSIKRVELHKYWKVLVKNYNKIPLTKKIDVDLADYVTLKTIDGLFLLLEKEESNIRNNPKARISDILKKVFK